MSNISSIFQLLKLAEGLKRELRHSWLSDGRHESVAEHTWRTALMAFVFHPYLEQKIDLLRVLKMILIHDLPEALVGDIPAFDIELKNACHIKKASDEGEAMAKIGNILGDALGKEMVELWEEFEEKQTPEALFANALDKLEAQFQHNEADLETWLEWERQRVFGGLDAVCKSFPILEELNQELQKDAKIKFRGAGIDPEDYGGKNLD